MARPVYASGSRSYAPWDEPDQALAMCECGNRWEEHHNPEGNEKCDECKGSGVSVRPDWSELPVGHLILFGTDLEFELFLECSHCDGTGDEPSSCVKGCDCTRFVELEEYSISFRPSRRVYA